MKGGGPEGGGHIDICPSPPEGGGGLPENSPKWAISFEASENSPMRAISFDRL